MAGLTESEIGVNSLLDRLIRSDIRQGAALAIGQS